MQALTGIRVLDIATYIAAPYCATLLAEFGAEVIKVELPGGGEPMRKFGSPTDCGETLVWLSESRNKKCITLDLRHAAGADLFKRLVKTADVVCENFQPGTLEKWGLGYDVLQAINPRLVMLRVSGYGQTGPYRDRPGFGRIANAFGGISYLAGEPDRPPSSPGSATLADYLSGVYGAFGVLAALRARDKTDAGQVVDLGLYEPVFRILDELAPAYDHHGFIRERMGAATVNAVPHSHFPTADHRWVAIACTNDKIFSRLATIMNRAEVAGDGEFGTLRKREAKREAVDELVTSWTQSLPQAEVLKRCDAGQVPCGPVAAIDEIFANEQVAARENILRVTDERIGELAIPNVVPKLSKSPGQVNWLGPAVGEHNREIYQGLLGLSEEEIADLQNAGTI